MELLGRVGIMKASYSEAGPRTAMEASALAGIDRRSAIEAVRARIGVAIALGLLQPGERLPDQQDIALGLSVSPITARRAMASLAEDGVVTRRRGRDGGTFVAANPPQDILDRFSAGAADAGRVHELVDRRMLQECAVTHFSALNATADQLAELDSLTRAMASARNWSEYHQADNRFHRLVAESAQLGPATEVYNSTLAALYEHFIPYKIEILHKSNEDHIALVAALSARDVAASVQISRSHVDVLHRTMFMALAGAEVPALEPELPAHGDRGDRQR